MCNLNATAILIDSSKILAFLSVLPASVLLTSEAWHTISFLFVVSSSLSLSRKASEALITKVPFFPVALLRLGNRPSMPLCMGWFSSTAHTHFVVASLVTMLFLFSCVCLKVCWGLSSISLTRSSCVVVESTDRCMSSALALSAYSMISLILPLQSATSSILSRTSWFSRFCVSFVFRSFSISSNMHWAMCFKFL